MSTYSPTAVQMTSFTIPADGEDVDAASVNVPLEAIADGVKWLMARRNSTIYVPCGSVMATTSGAVTKSITATFGTNPNFTFTGESIVTTLSSASATDARGFVIPLTLALVNGATFASAILKFGLGVKAGVPAGGLPQFSICRADKSGVGTISSLLSTTWAVDPGGSYTSGATRTVTFTADQNNVIDTSAYSYFAVVFDEHGANAAAGNAFHSFAISLTSLPDVT